MSRVLGIDLDTRALHLVLVDDDSGRAEYLPVPFVGHKPPFRFTDARAVRPRLNEVIAASSQDGWDSIYLVGVEKPYSQNTDNAWKYGLVVGALLAAIPRRIETRALSPDDWHRAFLGQAKSKKDEPHIKEQVAARALELGFGAGLGHDATDAFGIAWAVRDLWNETRRAA